MNDVMSKVRGYIEENFLYMRPDVELGDDDSLLGTGIVDSMGVMEIIAFLEDEFGVIVEDEEITEENLGTLSAIGRYAVTKGALQKPQVA